MDNQIQLQLQLHHFCIINYNFNYNYVIGPGSGCITWFESSPVSLNLLPTPANKHTSTYYKRVGREGGSKGGSDDARQGESVSGGREGWGRKDWWRERTRKGQNEAWTARGKERREEGSGGGIERGRDGARQQGSKETREQGREGNFKGGILRRALAIIYIIREEGSIFAPQRLRFFMALGVAANTIGKVIASTVFMCVCSMFRPSDGGREGGSEWRRDWARKEGSMGAREGENVKGGSIFTNQSIHKPALALETLVLQMTNSEHV